MSTNSSTTVATEKQLELEHEGIKSKFNLKIKKVYSSAHTPSTTTVAAATSTMTNTTTVAAATSTMTNTTTVDTKTTLMDVAAPLIPINNNNNNEDIKKEMGNDSNTSMNTNTTANNVATASCPEIKSETIATSNISLTSTTTTTTTINSDNNKVLSVIKKRKIIRDSDDEVEVEVSKNKNTNSNEKTTDTATTTIATSATTTLTATTVTLPASTNCPPATTTLTSVATTPVKSEGIVENKTTPGEQLSTTAATSTTATNNKVLSLQSSPQKKSLSLHLKKAAAAVHNTATTTIMTSNNDTNITNVADVVTNTTITTATPNTTTLTTSTTTAPPTTATSPSPVLNDLIISSTLSAIEVLRRPVHAGELQVELPEIFALGADPVPTATATANTTTTTATTHTGFQLSWALLMLRSDGIQSALQTFLGAKMKAILHSLFQQARLSDPNWSGGSGSSSGIGSTYGLSTSVSLLSRLTGVSAGAGLVSLSPTCLPYNDRSVRMALQLLLLSAPCHDLLQPQSVETLRKSDNYSSSTTNTTKTTSSHLPRNHILYSLGNDHFVLRNILPTIVTEAAIHTIETSSSMMSANTNTNISASGSMTRTSDDKLLTLVSNIMEVLVDTRNSHDDTANVTFESQSLIMIEKLITVLVKEVVMD